MMQLESSVAPRKEPAPAAPVRLQGRMTPHGYEAENEAWKVFLTQPDKRLGTRPDGSPRLAGRDPLMLPLEILVKAGHPNRRTSALVSALGNPNGHRDGNEEGDPMGGLSAIRVCGDIPDYCNECAGGAFLRRKCGVIDCPFWAYRMGRNPHNPRRGKRPTFSPARGEIDHEGEVPATYVAGTLH